MMSLDHFNSLLDSLDTVEQVNQLHEMAEDILKYAALAGDMGMKHTASEYRLAAQGRALEIMDPSES
ncbi:MAG: hypothetical protein MN733_01665 [Nitrososphaera sp.]|nr:hypothetical protein [Nitrososphaera sp.]